MNVHLSRTPFISRSLSWALIPNCYKMCCLEHLDVSLLITWIMFKDFTNSKCHQQALNTECPWYIFQSSKSGSLRPCFQWAPVGRVIIISFLTHTNNQKIPPLSQHWRPSPQFCPTSTPAELRRALLAAPRLGRRCQRLHRFCPWPGLGPAPSWSTSPRGRRARWWQWRSLWTRSGAGWPLSGRSSPSDRGGIPARSECSLDVSCWIVWNPKP